MQQSFSIQYDFLKKGWTLAMGTVLLASIQLCFFAVFGEQTWWSHLMESPLRFFRLIIWERLLIEGLATFIIFYLLIGVGEKWNRKIELKGIRLLRYFGKFLPALLGAFLIYGPFTMGLRYLGRHYGQLDWQTFAMDYLLRPQVYFGYLIPTLIFGYLVILYNLYRNVELRSQEERGAERSGETLQVFSNYRKISVDPRSIYWIEKKNRKVFIKTKEDCIPVSTSLKELENQLSKTAFFRVNRSCLIARSMILDYSFWEHDKYILRAKDEETSSFVMSRKRMQVLRDIT